MGKNVARPPSSFAFGNRDRIRESQPFGARLGGLDGTEPCGTGDGARSSQRMVGSQDVRGWIAVEAKLVIELGKTVIYPVALAYLAEVGSTHDIAAKLGADLDTSTASTIAAEAKALLATVTELESELAKHDFDSLADHPEHCAKTVRGPT